MKGLMTLIKLSKRTLDELRRKMTSFENQRSQLQQSVINLQTEIDTEMKAASERPEMSQFFGEFARRIRQRQHELREEIKKVEKQMDVLRNEMAIAFAEQKKYEIALENAKLRLKEAAARRDTELMDEIAGQQHHRKQDD